MKVVGYTDMHWDFGAALREQINREDEVGWAARELVKDSSEVMGKELPSQRWIMDEDRWAAAITRFINKLWP